MVTANKKVAPQYRAALGPQESLILVLNRQAADRLIRLLDDLDDRSHFETRFLQALREPVDMRPATGDGPRAGPV